VRRRPVWRTIVLSICGLIVAGLTACAFGVDAEQFRVCRETLPALNPGLKVTVKGARPGPEKRSIRVEYTVQRIDRPALDRWVICRFAGDELATRKSELIGLATETGPLSGASLYLMKRYYLETPEGVSGDPGSSAGSSAPVIPNPVAYALQQILSGLPRMAVYGLIASAYALVFGLVRRINLAFGELVAVGSIASIAGAALGTVGMDWSVAGGIVAGLSAALFAGSLHGAVGGWLTIGAVRGPSPQPSLIATVGLSLFLMEYLRLAQSPVTVWLPPIGGEPWSLARAGDFVVSLKPVSLATALFGLGAALIPLALGRSRFGREWRAYAEDPDAARLFGVDEGRLLLGTLAVAGALAGLAGMLIVIEFGGLGFAGGFQFGLKALLAAVVGGIGSVPGALAGGWLVGLFESLWSAYLPIESRDIALYLALATFLVFRPGGIFGIRDVTPRPV
jgi:branched-chain amino acid transport system permease protein